MIDTIMVINSGSLPIFSYDRKAKKDELISDDELLLSSFFSAIIDFSKHLKADELKYIVFDKRSFIIKKTTDFTLVFSTYTTFKEADFSQIENLLENTSKYLIQLLKDEGFLPNNQYILKESTLKPIVNKFAQFLLDNGIILENEFNFDPLYVQKKYRKFIFNSIGYEPGKCNIGPQERLKRLIIGLVGLISSFIVLFFMVVLNLPHLYRLLLFFPIAWSFIGFYQYFFKFCIGNALSKRAVMK